MKIGFKLAEIEDFRNRGYFCPPLKNGPSRSPAKVYVDGLGLHEEGAAEVVREAARPPQW